MNVNKSITFAQEAKMKIFPIYRVIKSYRAQGHKIIYINLFWIWGILSCITGGYFSAHYIFTQADEYQQMKKNYADYVKHPVELPVLPIMANLLKTAQESKSAIDFSSYREIKIDKDWKKGSDAFELKILAKSQDSDQWFLQIQTSEYANPILYNPDWLIYYPIPANTILAAKISNYTLYFETERQFKGQKICQLLTWSPSYAKLYALNSLAVISVIFVCCLISITAVALLRWLIVSWYKISVYNGDRYSKNYFLDNQESIGDNLDKIERYLFLGYPRQIRITWIRRM